MSDLPESSASAAPNVAPIDAAAPPLPPEQAEMLARLAPGVLYAAEQDMWVLPEADGTLRVGATHLVAAHGQFMLFTPRPQGTEVARDHSLGVMETAKTAVAIHAPVSGRIVETNLAVVDDVTLVERDPYGTGWLFRLRPTALEAERDGLRDMASYATWLAPRLGEKMVKPIADEFGEDLTIDPHRGY
jgi:glycine cleavage system H protein